MEQRHSLLMLLGLLLHSLYSFLAFAIVYAFHLAVVRMPHWLESVFPRIDGAAVATTAEGPVGDLVAKAVAYTILVGGGVCCISFVLFETIKFVKQVRNSKPNG